MQQEILNMYNNIVLLVNIDKWFCRPIGSILNVSRFFLKNILNVKDTF